MSLGDGYMLGKWTSDDLVDTMYRLAQSRDMVRLVKNKEFDRETAKAINLQLTDPEAVIRGHYDIGNDVFQAMLGPTMAYTCGYWDNVDTLDAAQNQKFGIILEKLEIEERMSVLDLGCGFGAFAMYCEKIGLDLDITGITLSEQQAKMARQHCDVKVCDYSEARGKFDRVISLGLLEHVGPHNYRRYMKTVYRTLKNDGIHLFQTIGYNTSHHVSYPWVDTRIFPNGVLPSFAQLATAMDGLFVLEDVENFGPDYSKTALAWWKNFSENYAVSDDEASLIFWRMWQFYLVACSAGFASREQQLWQVVTTKRRLKKPVRV